MTVKEITAQELVGRYYYKEEKKLKIYGSERDKFTEWKIVGKVDISKFTDLEKLVINDGFFPYLDTSKCVGLPIRELEIATCIDDRGRNINLKDFPNLVKLKLSGGSALTSLDLTANAKLEEVEADGEETSELDLKIFSHLTNLKKLDLGYIKGSYKSLENCKNLEHLSIKDSTHFELPSDGLEYLDLNKLKYLHLGLDLLPYKEHLGSQYAATGKIDSVDPLKRKLEPYNWDIKAWKLVNHPDLINTDKKIVIQELDKRIAEVEKVYRSPYKKKLEILQDARTQKLREIVFP